MEELAQIMRLHAEKYPGMKPQDCIKLLYQNTWGGGHMIADPEKSLAYLKQELAEVKPDPEGADNGRDVSKSPIREDRTT